MFHDSNAAALTYNYKPPRSMTHHQVNSIRTDRFGQDDTTIQPELLPNFSTASFSSTIPPVHASASLSVVPPQTSFPCLPDHTNPNSVVTCAQYLPPVSTEPLINMAYRSSFPAFNKHPQSQPLKDHYQMNGSYSSGMSNLQQEFARMVNC